MANSNCSCNKPDSHYSIVERVAYLGDKSEVTVNIPQCPTCLGALNGRVDSHMYQFSKDITDAVQAERDYLVQSNSFQELYEDGYEMGFSEGVLSETHSLLGSNCKGQFLVGQDEFGEIYHTALAMLCHPAVNANLSAASVCQTIFIASLFEKSRCVYNDVQVIPRTTSTSMFLDLFNSDAVIEDPHATVLQAFTRNLINRPYIDDCNQNHSEQESLISKLETVLTQLSIDVDSAKAIVWIRSKNDETRFRNLNDDFLLNIIAQVTSSGITDIILAGDRPSEEQGNLLKRTYPRVIFYDLAGFQERIAFKLVVGDHQVAGQLLLFKTLQERFNAKFAIGMMSGGMDGPAFIGMPTIILTFDSEEARIPMACRSIKSMICVHYDRDSLKLVGEIDIRDAIQHALSLNNSPDADMDLSTYSMLLF